MRIFSHHMDSHNGCEDVTELEIVCDMHGQGSFDDAGS